MMLPKPLRRILVLVGATFALSVFHLPSTAAAGRAIAKSTANAPVSGLIVQLRDAPSHVALARERSLALPDGIHVRETARWQRVVADLRSDAVLSRELPAWARAAPVRDPVGERAQLLRFERPLSAEQAERVAARIAARPDVAWVTLNARERRQGTALNAPGDPLYAGLAGQWWLQAVQGSDANPIAARLRGVAGFLPAWLNSSNGSAAAVVAVLDSGITCHPDLGNLTSTCIGGAILPGYDFVADSGYANDGGGRDSDPRDPGDWVSLADQTADPARFGDCVVEDSSWHGTTIAGVIAAKTDNGIGAAGINWNGRVVPVRVAGKCGADKADIIEGMRWAAGLSACKTSDGAGNCLVFAPANANPARVINISFGGDAACGVDYQAAIDQVRAAGAVVVAAAGNAWGAPTRPASCHNVIGVAALNRDGFKANYSNFGPALAIATVGGDDNFDMDSGAWAPLMADSGILTIGNSALTTPSDCTQPGASCYFYHFGSSFSAPIVAGTVSLMLSVNPALTAAQIEQGLARSARPHVRSTVPGFAACSDLNPGRCLCTTSTCGAGILDAAQALLYASNPAAYVNTRSADVLDNPELRAAVAVGPDRPANPGAVIPSSGGGAMSAFWLLALLAATLALARPVSSSAPTARRVPASHTTPSCPAAARR